MKLIKKNNKGFSLIELIVGIALLAIISVPLLMVFASSMGTANRSQEIGEATLVAENIAEQFEAMSFDTDDFKEQGDAPSIINGKLSDGSDISIVGDFLVLNSAATGVENKYLSYAFGVNSTEELKSPYTIGYGNFDAGYSDFYAVVTLDAGEAVPDVIPDGYQEDAYTVLNSLKTAQYTSMKYMYAQTRNISEDPDQKAFEEFFLYLSKNGITEEDIIMDNLISEREILLDIDSKNDSDISGNTVYTANLSFKYSFEYETQTGQVYPKAGDYSEGLYTDPYYEFEVLGNKGLSIPSDEELPPIYVLFFPWYYEEGDNITINNQNDIPLNLILAKQKDNELTQEQIDEAEKNYQGAIVQLKLPNTSTNEDEMKVSSNLKDDFYEGTDFFTGYENLVQYRVQKGSVFSSSVEFYDDALISRESDDRILKMTIEIYQTKGLVPTIEDSPVYTITTSKLIG